MIRVQDIVKKEETTQELINSLLESQKPEIRDRNTRYLKKKNERYELSNSEREKMQEKISESLEEYINGDLKVKLDKEIQSADINFISEQTIKKLKEALSKMKIPFDSQFFMKRGEPIVKIKKNNIRDEIKKEINFVNKVFYSYSIKSVLNNPIKSDKTITAKLQDFGCEKNSITVEEKYEMGKITPNEYEEILKYSLKLIEEDISKFNIAEFKCAVANTDRNYWLEDHKSQLKLIEAKKNDPDFLKQYVDEILNQEEKHDWIIRTRLMMKAEEIRNQQEKERIEKETQNSTESKKGLLQILAKERVNEKEKEIENKMKEGNFQKIVDDLSGGTFTSEELKEYLADELADEKINKFIHLEESKQSKNKLSKKNQSKHKQSKNKKKKKY